MRVLNRMRVATAATVVMGLAGCHSYHVDATVENRTGQELKLVEVDYPSASFGKDTMAPGEVLHYRMQFIGSKAMQVHYWTGESHLKETTIAGPEFQEREEGALKIVLEPDGKADFEISGMNR